MIIVAEKINTSRQRIEDAVRNCDGAFIIQAAREQAEAGTHFIDANAGTFVEQETDYLCWLVDLVAVLLHCGVIDHEGLIRLSPGKSIRI